MNGLILKSRRVVLPTGTRPASVIVEDGRIKEIRTDSSLLKGRVVDLGDKALLPGLVDTHAHINEPGRSDWEGFETATRAAAAGGITTVVDMPLNSIPPTTTQDALRAKRAAADGKCAIDYAFWGGVIPGNAGELPRLAEMGVLGFKCFLIDSGVTEFPMVKESDLRTAMPLLAKLGLPLLVHAELHGPASALSSTRRYENYLASRPPEWEVSAVRLMSRLCEETGCRVHIVHLSAAEALPEIIRARRAGLPMSAETCPHYLALTAEEIPDGATGYKCAPPIRGKDNQEKLWTALQEGNIDFIVSDHSPCSPQLKRLEEGDFAAAWGGIAGLQFGISVVWTQMRRRGMTLDDLARLLSQKSAKFAGLESKGAIAPGKDADFAVFDPDAEFILKDSMVRHRHPLTPYSDKTWFGAVEATYLRGAPVYQRGAPDVQPFGKEIKSCSPISRT